MDSDYDWASQQRQNSLVITAAIMVTISFIFVLLRVISRFILIRSPGWDDYFILGAMILTIGYMADILVLKVNRVGFPMSTLTYDNMINMTKTALAIQVAYYGIVFCIKNSIVLTYLRFAVNSTFRRLCVATVVLHSIFFAICITVTLGQCRPLEKMWDLMGTVQGTCINTTAFFYATSGFNIITDIWIILLPLPTLRSINRHRNEKIALFCIFSVGSFAAIASIIRLHTIYQYTEAVDPFRDSIPVNLWSIIEVTIAIPCASVSALKPIFSRRQRGRSRATAGSNTRGTGGGGSGGGSRNEDTTLVTIGGSGGKGWRATRGSRRDRLGSKDRSGHDDTTLRSSVGEESRSHGGTADRNSFQMGLVRHQAEDHSNGGRRTDPAISEERLVSPFRPASSSSRTASEDQIDHQNGLPVGSWGDQSSSESVSVLETK